MNFIKPEEFLSTGIPGKQRKNDQKLFLDIEEEKAQQILDVLSGTRICWALSMLDRCKAAILQHRVMPLDPDDPQA